jgi:hypothetical protein
MKKIFVTAFLGMATVALSSCGLLNDHPVDQDNNNGTFEIYLLPLELAGQPFAVCVKQEPIYMGEFMALFMSRSSEGVVILWPPLEGDEPVMKIQLGYSGPDFYTGEDPRSDSRILRALDQAGLIDQDLEK